MDQRQWHSPGEQGCPGAFVRQQQVPLGSGSTRGSPGKTSRWTPPPPPPLTVSLGEGVRGAARRTLRLQGPFTTSRILWSRRNPPGAEGTENRAGGWGRRAHRDRLLSPEGRREKGGERGEEGEVGREAGKSKGGERGARRGRRAGEAHAERD